MEKRLRTGIVILFFLAMTTSASALSPCADLTRFSSETRRILMDYGAGWQGDDKALLAMFEAVEKSEAPWVRDSLLRAYYGSACIARARMVPDRQKPRWLRRGAAHLDAAVASAPNQPQVRFLRAISFAILPRLAGRLETVEADFALLVEEADSGNHLGEECRQAIYYHAGVFALRNREFRATTLLERAAELEPDEGIERERIRRMLRAAEGLQGGS